MRKRVFGSIFLTSLVTLLLTMFSSSCVGLLISALFSNGESAILAVLVLVYPDNLMTILPFGMGIYVLSDALLKLQTAIDAKLFGMRQWVGLLVASLIASVAGVISLVVSVSLQEPTILVGIAIAADGALNFFNTMATVRVGVQKKDRLSEGEKKN